jgi:hypothetical protein
MLNAMSQNRRAIQSAIRSGYEYREKYSHDVGGFKGKCPWKAVEDVEEGYGVEGPVERDGEGLEDVIFVELNVGTFISGARRTLRGILQ